jgi:mRNA-degrading endonuclease RelE of RelBE toxin-antitoxin system
MPKPKKPAVTEHPKFSKATSKSSLKIEIDPELLQQLRALDKDQRRVIGERIEKVRVSFGHPHLHGGTGLRALRSGVYECRLNLRQRLVFTLEPGSLYFHFMGNHEEVNRFLKSF